MRPETLRPELAPADEFDLLFVSTGTPLLNPYGSFYLTGHLNDVPVAELRRLQRLTLETGGVASFVGYVRDTNQGDTIGGLTLEHYPGMTERSLERICAQAEARWPLLGVTVIHRVGPLAPGDQIVLVATASRHRDAAFESCRFIMDYLKTEAPFWKKETTPDGERWVDARDSDEAARRRWVTN